MKIADKRNKNKMKQEHKMNNLKATNEVYALEHGPYKVVSFVNLGGSMEVLSEKYFANKNMNLVYEKERRMNFLFVNTESFNDLENAYITRVSDIVVFVINSENPDADRMKLIKKHIPSCLFVIMDKKYKKSAKKLVKKNLPDTKIVEYNVLLENMCILKQVNTVVSKRPYMVPFEVRVEDEFMYFKGFMKSGLQSSKIIINGKHTLEIEEVKVNAWIKGSDLNMSGEEKSKFAIYNDFNDMLIEMNSDCEKENLEQFRMEIEDDEVEDDYDKEEEIDFDDISENSEKEYPSLVQKYYEYRGVRNLTTCDLPVEKYPEYYKDLIFFKDFKRVEKYVLSRKSVIDDNQMVEVKVRYNPNVVGNIFVLFSNYEFEDCKTILNYTFNADVPINDDKIIVDFGHKLAEIAPTVTRTANFQIFKKEKELKNGTISFIAPLVFNSNKILGFEANALLEIRKELYKFSGVNCLIKERKLVDEVVLKGRPIKVHKRSCIVRRMFYTKEEVLHFKNIRLTTKNARADGFIKKPIGVHGTFRAYFSSPILSGESIQMSLYKRIFIDDYTK